MKTWKRRWFILTDNCLYYFEYTTVSDLSSGYAELGQGRAPDPAQRSSACVAQTGRSIPARGWQPASCRAGVLVTVGLQDAALRPGSTRCLCGGVLGIGVFAASSPAWGTRVGFGDVQPAAKAFAWPHQDKEPRGIIPLENLSIREVEDSKKPVSAAAGSPGLEGQP